MENEWRIPIRSVRGVAILPRRSGVVVVVVEEEEEDDEEEDDEEEDDEEEERERVEGIWSLLKSTTKFSKG